jgi:hypothetical protein
MVLVHYIDQIIQFAAGVWFTAIGYSRAASMKTAEGVKPRYPAWAMKIFRIGGPLLTVFAVAMAAAKYFGAGS